MAIIESHSCKSYDTVKYVLSNKPHCNKLTDKRVLDVSLTNLDGLCDNNGNLLRIQNPAYIINQFRASLDKSRAGRHKRHKLQSIIISFSHNEFDTSDLSTQASEAQRIVGLYVKKYFDDAQSLSVVQADNDSGHLHVHLLVGSVRTNGTTIPTSRFTVSKLRKQFDHLLATNFEKVTNREWLGSADKVNRKAKNDLFTRSSWEKQIKQIIMQTVQAVDSVTEFKEKLKECGITVKERKKGAAWTYSQSIHTVRGVKTYRVRDYYIRRDKSGAIKSRRGLGAHFTKKNIEEYIKEKEADLNGRKDDETKGRGRNKEAVGEGYKTLSKQVTRQQRINATKKSGEHNGEETSRESQRQWIWRRGNPQQQTVPNEEQQNRRSTATTNGQQPKVGRNVKQSVNKARRAKRCKTRQNGLEGPEF